VYKRQVDPLAGSYYVESLTNELIGRATALIAEVDALGGSVEAIESGWMQVRIADSAYRAQQAIEKGEQIVVGVNKFGEGAPKTAMPLQRLDPQIERAQAQRLKDLRKKRDDAAVGKHLDAVRKTAQGTGNLMPTFIEAVDAGATLGEICDVLREVFGVYRASEVVA